jgi:predicted nucleic acid-binding protein
LIAYFDTSAIVPLLVEEIGTKRARDQWLAADRLVTVRLAHVEARAALAQAERVGRVTSAQRRSLGVELDDLLGQMDYVDVDEALVRSAGDLAEVHPLRAYDAVHLAAAVAVASDDLVVIAGDRALISAAQAAGLATSPIG